MAAKVVIVAVPTVLSIASIRVYTVSEAPTDGLITREKLNIYTPLPQCAQPQFVPERPGVIQSGLTAARETILPYVQAVKGAFVSVKGASVNLYHGGEDVFYYLKDPPPGFLPRLGTITMAGLLGMFLARKGSRFKRLAIPLGLMSAGASVCYPAQAVAVLKVSGKKVYAAGQWSSAAVSSLLTPKPQEPVAKEFAASQPQAATVPNPESAVVEEASEASSPTDSSVQSSTIPETKVESAESVPVSDEPIVAVITEEASSVTLTEISPEQSPTETDTDPVAHSVPAETETTTTSEEISAPVESEEPSDTKQAAEDVSTDASQAQPMPSLETIESAPTESAPTESAPTESAPTECAPEESAPAESAPEESGPTESPSAESAPAESAPAESAPEESAPEESAPEESAPEESAPEESGPTESPSAESAPAESAPAESAPEESAPEESAPEESAPEESGPTESPSAESASAESAPDESVPSSEEPPVSQASAEPAVPVVESAEPEPADPPQVAAVEETPIPTLTPPPPQQPAAENSKGGSAFKPDPAILDFGQSIPEDEDLYSTRS